MYIFRSYKAYSHRIKKVFCQCSGIVYCSIGSPQIYVSYRRRARGDNFVIGFKKINKYTSVSEKVHLSLRKNRQLGHISVATGRIPSLFCDTVVLRSIPMIREGRMSPTRISNTNSLSLTQIQAFLLNISVCPLF